MEVSDESHIHGNTGFREKRMTRSAQDCGDGNAEGEASVNGEVGNVQYAE